MQNAIFITKISNANFIAEKFERLYFGIEFCERLLPSVEILSEIINLCNRKKLNFTLVTPFLTDAGLKKTDLLIEFLSNNQPVVSDNSKTEIVINDWGLLSLIKEKKYPLTPILGRLLHKIKRGPNILGVLDKIPKTMLQHIQSSNISLLHFRKFLHSVGIKRLAIDNLLQGIVIDLNFEEYPMHGSLYYPFGYITTTRFCLTAGCDKLENVDRFGIYPCAFECQKYSYIFQTPKMPVKILVRGNTHFYKKDSLPDNLEMLGIDRLVYQPEIPI